MSKITAENKDMNPLRLEGTKKENVEELRKALHHVVDSMIDRIEYDKYGDAVNPIKAVESREFTRYPAMSDIDAFLPGATKLEFSVGSTFRELVEEVERLKVGDAVASAQQQEKRGYTTMRAVVPEPPPPATETK